MPAFEIQTKQLMRIVRIELKDEAVRVEAGAMYYMLGSIGMDAQLPSVGGFLKSMVTSEKAVKPIYKGTGQLFLEPSYGEFTVLELADGDEWILDKGDDRLDRDGPYRSGLVHREDIPEQNRHGRHDRRQAQSSGHGPHRW